MLTLEQIDKKLLHCAEALDQLQTERESLEKEYKREDGSIVIRMTVLNKERNKLIGDKTYKKYSK